MQTRATPAVARALESLEALRCLGARTGERLPTVATLARHAGVSVRTMHRAVRVLAEQRALSVRQRGGIRWADPAAAVPLPVRNAAPAARAGRADLLVDEIERAVLSGTLPTPLPSVKELRARYRAGHLAVGRALAALAHRGSIVRRGRQWVVARAESDSGMSRIMLVGPGDTLAQFAGYDSKAAEFCTGLERECTLQRTSVLFQTIFRPIHADPSLHGYLLIAGHDTQTQTTALNTLLAGRRPVVVVDILGDCPVPDIVRTRHVPVVSIQGARAAGRQVAMLLRKLGHRRVVFLSQYSTEQGVGHSWVLNRLNGMRDVFGDGVVDISSREFSSRDTTEGHFSRDVLPSVAHAVDELAAQIGRYHDIVDGRWVADVLTRPLASRLAESRLEPLFRQAAADRAISAWVGANDEAALAALGYLSTHSVGVPQRVSVVGFDGSPAALLADLTTFDFNASGVVRASLDLVLRPSTAQRTNSLAVTVPGILAPRSTVGPA